MPDPDPAALAFLGRRHTYPAKALPPPAPDREALRQILSVALRVPDHGILEPWRLIVLERPALDRLAALAARRGEALGLPPEVAAKGPGQFTRSALAIAVVASPRPGKIPEIEQILSSGALCLGICNTAMAAGWGAAWITGWPAEDRPFVEEGLGLTPSEFIAGFIHLGTPTAEPPDRPRPDLSRIVTWAPRMIVSDFLKAIAQFGDARFRRVMAVGLGLTLALLIALACAVFWLIGVLAPDTITLPWIGAVSWVETALSWAGVLVVMGLSVFLMVPVASAFTGIFLDDVAQAVEDRHYPHLPAARHVPMGEILRDTAALFGLIIVLNLGLLIVYVFSGPLVPILFWAVNGFLLGREYFQTVAVRRMSRTEAAALRSQNWLQIWAAGVLMAVPLTIPIVNLFVPVLGAATFTHLFHRVAGTAAGPLADRRV